MPCEVSPPSGFNTQPPEGGCLILPILQKSAQKFQHTAARRRLRRFILSPCKPCCFNTQPPEGGCARPHGTMPAWTEFQHTAARRRLLIRCSGGFCLGAFQHTAARRRLPDVMVYLCEKSQVSTHSRPKAAATATVFSSFNPSCFNTQPPEGGCQNSRNQRRAMQVSTHSRPKAAARHCSHHCRWSGFQHTAARRRLRHCSWFVLPSPPVSTHSRPKAAAFIV